jgi:predicted nucleic-acid-binding Zn-ribbon protein
MARPGSLVTIGTAAFRCLVCGNRQFWDRPIKLNTTATEFFGFEWANRSSLGLICCRCGYVHEFLGEQVSLWNADSGYPQGTSNAE